MKRRLVLLALASLNVAVVVGAACGARSQLDVGAAIDDTDAGPDAPVDAPRDAPKDAPKDVPVDVPIDVPEDVMSDCADPSTTFIYLVTSENDLYSLNPANGSLVQRGTLDCPFQTPGAAPFSMSVDRKGTAYVLYGAPNPAGTPVYLPGELFRVSTKDASCAPTTFVPGQHGFDVFGMGYALDGPGASTETLYVAEISFQKPSKGLASIDTTSMTLSPIGLFSSNPSNELEMTSASDGNLYGFFLDAAQSVGWVVQIDKPTASVLSETQIPVAAGSALAFAAWGGNFYIFTAVQGSTNVTLYKPSDGSVTPNWMMIPHTVVGAGVSTCAPM